MRIDRQGRIVLFAGLTYVVALIAVVGCTVAAFGDLHSDPPYAAAAERYGAYRAFIRIPGAGLALYLGIWAAVFGAWRKNLWHGLAVLATGTAATLLALSYLPWIRFPFDRYAAPAAWIFGNALPLVIGWAVTGAACHWARRDRD